MLSEWLGHPMVLPIIVPLLAGVLCLIIPRGGAALRSGLAVLAALATLLLAWPLFRGGEAVFEPFSWLTLRVDTLSAFVLLAVTVFGFLIALYSVGYMKGRDRHGPYFAYLLWTLGASCAAVLANDLLLLLVCWGVLALLLYLMIGIAGPKAAGAARKTLMVVGTADALLLLGIVMYWQLAGSTQVAGPGVVPVALDSVAAHGAFLCILAGALAKAGAVPFHSWVPVCGEKADAPVSAFLPASLDKLLGIYLLARCMLDLFELSPAMYLLLMLIGAVTILTMSLGALIQRDMKRLLSYTAVAQVGYIILGLASGTLIGLAGGLFHMLNHAIYKSGLFLCAGVVEKEAGGTRLDRLGGLARMMPVTFGVCLVTALAGAGIPPLNGFASKWMVYQGIISSAGETAGFGWVIWLVVAMLGSALTLAAFVKMLHAVFLCKASPEIRARAAAQGIGDGAGTMRLPMLVLAALCIVFGVAALQVPLTLLVLPAIGAETELASVGVWWSGLATVLILASIVIGLLGYFLSMRAGKLRRMGTYIGGEHIDNVYISGEKPAQERHVEVTGVDFYRTIEGLPLIGRAFTRTHAKLFDIYHLGRNTSGYMVQLLSSFHTGILPAYLRWFVVGMLVVVWVVTQSGT
ncbi:MAG: proton-conducting transporter membrane subunit [Lysobacterales bacterium]|jgi:formate hydrogenlyase subunit 3/multisubunit Na+/H+ antiporter MnhD subunit